MLELFDTFIGIFSIYLLLSMIVSAVASGASELLKLKGRIVQKMITQLLGPNLAREMLREPAITDLAPNPPKRKSDGVVARVSAWLGFDGEVKPSYIPPELFVKTLILYLVNSNTNSLQKLIPVAEASVETTDQNSNENTESKLPKVVSPSPSQIDIKLRDLRDTLNAVKPDLGEQLTGLWQDAGFNIEKFESLIVIWFDRVGDRSYGWYRRRMGIITCAIGLVVASLLNADTIQIFKILSENQDLQQQYVNQAIDIVDEGFVSQDQLRQALCERNSQATDPECSSDDVKQTIDVLLPELLPVLGWEDFALCGLKEVCSYFDQFLYGMLKFMGLFLTAAAVSLGAPFWFDLLHKVIEIRGKVKTSTSDQAEDSDEVAIAGIGSENVDLPAAKSVIKSIAAQQAKLETLNGFIADKFGYDPVNIYWSARLSLLAYADEGEIAAALEQFEATGKLLSFSNNDIDTQCLVAHTPHAVFISFRGTENKLVDWLTDLKINLEKPSWDAQADFCVHEGFQAGLDCVWDELETYLEENKLLQGNKPIWFSGHSLGGAVAVLAALRLASTHKDVVVAGIHTFGQPRACDSKCGRELDRLFPNRYFRCISQRDIVARVPLCRSLEILAKISKEQDPEILDYAHGGRVVYFNDIGRAIMDPPVWYRKLDVVAVATNKEAIKDALRQVVGDHSMHAYLDLNKSLLTEAGL